MACVSGNISDAEGTLVMISLEGLPGWLLGWRGSAQTEVFEMLAEVEVKAFPILLCGPE